MKETRDIDGLIKALGYEKDILVRRNAAQALGAIGDSRAVEPLTRTLSDVNRYVRRDAMDALDKLGCSLGSDEVPAPYCILRGK
jgi:HEAT repeat protein